MKSIISLLIIAIFFASTQSVNAAPWAGSGTSTDPYQIWNAGDLNAIGANTTYYGSSFILMADINLAGITYTNAVIPYSDTAFTGVFDGNTHIISNLTINTSGAGTSYLGLFGYLGINPDSSFVLKDLGIKNLSITAGNSSQNIGALAGVSDSGTISECFAQGTITGGDASVNVGGLVGTNASAINNCYAVVDVNGGAGSQAIGGLAGYYYGGAQNCYAAGHVTGGSDVGGFAGQKFFFWTRSTGQ